MTTPHQLSLQTKDFGRDLVKDFVEQVVGVIKKAYDRNYIESLEFSLILALFIFQVKLKVNLIPTMLDNR